MIYRLIAPEWAIKENSIKEKVKEFENPDQETLEKLNQQGYNIYYYPNIETKSGPNANALDAVNFNWVFVDLDLKDYKSPNQDRTHDYETKQQFIDALLKHMTPPNFIVDSGNGVHAYWNLPGLDAMSYLKIQRRLARTFKTDPAVSMLCQLMRAPGFYNTKFKDKKVLADIVYSNETAYEVDEVLKHLNVLEAKDEAYCTDHYNSIHGIGFEDRYNNIPEVPAKFYKILQESPEINKLFTKTEVGNRSTSDFRMAHLLRAHGITELECMSIMMNTEKATERSDKGRFTYAENIVKKVYAEEDAPKDSPAAKSKVLAVSAKQINLQLGTELLGERLPCSSHFDGTVAGFRRGQVLGLVAGSGVGKTSMALNYFGGFAKENADKDYIHVFVSLEQPVPELVRRWNTFSAGNASLEDAVYFIGNYNEDSSYRHLTLGEIKDQVMMLEKEVGRKVGCVVIDHIGIIKKSVPGNNIDGLMDVCQKMKSFAIETDTFLIMQSQTPREKAGVGDIELNKDAAFGTSAFENFVDYLVTLWQPLKRVYDKVPEMTVVCYKYCKIRAKDVLKDRIKEDVVFGLMFDVKTEHMRQLTTEEVQKFAYWERSATSIRNKDRKKEPAPITFYDVDKHSGKQ